MLAKLNPIILAHFLCATSVDLFGLTTCCHQSIRDGEPLIGTVFTIDSPAAVKTRSSCQCSYLVPLFTLEFKHQSQVMMRIEDREAK